MTEEIQKIKDEISALQNADVQNSNEHKKIMELLEPISETYKTVGLMARWLMAFLVFISVLMGVIANWARVINIFKK